MEGKLIFFTGVYDTLDIFSEALIRTFRKIGYDILEITINDLADGISKLAQFVHTPVKAAVVFNNLAFNLQLNNGKNMWEELGIPCINILMDHPFCYRDALEQAPSNAVVLCIDKKHMEYLRRFFPHIPIVGFLPHGGLCLDQEPMPIEQREIDLLYAGGLSRKFIDNVMPDFTQFAFDAKEVANTAYERLITDTEVTAEIAIEEALLAKGIRLTDQELSYVISQLHYVELLATSYYREKLIHTMLKAGLRVHLYGEGWDICEFANHPNLVWKGRISAQEVLEKMHHSKIVLNTMTWFKDGTHDRVLNGMLAGAVAVTDESIYMLEEFQSYPQVNAESAELVLFHLKEMEPLAQTVKDLLKQPGVLQQIADNGRKKAIRSHTWENRANELQEGLLT